MKPPAILLPATLRAAEPIAAFTPGARIVFQGDSITDGNRGRSAAFIIAAKFGAAFPDAKPEFFNRGLSGNTVLDLEPQGTLDLKPDVLSLLVGVNDRRGVPLEQYEQTRESAKSIEAVRYN